MKFNNRLANIGNWHPRKKSQPSEEAQTNATFSDLGDLQNKAIIDDGQSSHRSFRSKFYNEEGDEVYSEDSYLH